MEHAKGKWIYAGNTTMSIKDPIFYHANVICGGKRVAMVAGIGVNEAMANAHLIAAAPDLLLALKRIKTYRKWLKMSGGMDIYEIAKAAIAKATGE